MTDETIPVHVVPDRVKSIVACHRDSAKGDVQLRRSVVYRLAPPKTNSTGYRDFVVDRGFRRPSTLLCRRQEWGLIATSPLHTTGV